MLWRAGVALEGCRRQFITRQINPANLQSQQGFMECQAGNRGSSLAGNQELIKKQI